MCARVEGQGRISSGNYRRYHKDCCAVALSWVQLGREIPGLQMVIHSLSRVKGEAEDKKCGNYLSSLYGEILCRKAAVHLINTGSE